MVVWLVAPTTGIRPTMDKHQYGFLLGDTEIGPYIEIQTILCVVRRLHQARIDTNTTHHAVIPSKTTACLHAGGRKLSRIN